MQIGDIVDYKGSKGEVTMIMDEMVVVKLPDGKEYSLPHESVRFNGCVPTAPVSFRDIITAMKPHVKKTEFLQDLAKSMHESGISELHIRSGSIQAYVARETYEEKLARMEAEAKLEVAKRAREEFDRENAARS